MGGPAMQPKEFAKWKQKRLLGLSLKVVAPTGQYCGTKLINWDSNRWAFKPELGYRALGPAIATKQTGSRLGGTASFPISKRQSIKVSYSSGTYVIFGGNYQNVSMAWQYSWLGRPK